MFEDLGSSLFIALSPFIVIYLVGSLLLFFIYIWKNFVKLIEKNRAKKQNRGK